MNAYPDINPNIVSLVRKYARNLENTFQFKIAAEDFEQELMLIVVIALKNYNPKNGVLNSYINNVLFRKTKDIIRYSFRQKRKIAFFEAEVIENITADKSKENKLDFELYKELLPTSLANFLFYLKQIPANQLHKFIHPPNSQFKLIRKILKGKKRTSKMKNISCIETLSIRELAQLSEIDLFDLSSKINETSNWIKELKEKFERALRTKYEYEAKTSLNDSNKDFGSTKLTKGNFSVCLEIPKKVTWDQELLSNIYEKMDHEARREIFKVNYSIGEHEYSKLTDTVREAIAPARSTSYGKMKITISKEGE